MHVRRKGPPEWAACSAYVDGSLDSDRPTWLLRALKGRQWVELAGGPMETRPAALAAAEALNLLDPSRWDLFITRELPRLLAGEWG